MWRLKMRPEKMNTTGKASDNFPHQYDKNVCAVQGPGGSLGALQGAALLRLGEHFGGVYERKCNLGEPVLTT